jgi:hypothetical protein
MGAEQKDESQVMFGREDSSKEFDRTEVKQKTLNPNFDEEFRIFVPFDVMPIDGVVIEIWDWNKVMKHKLIGNCFVSLAGLCSGDPKRMNLAVYELERKDVVLGDGKLNIEVTALNFNCPEMEQSEENPFKVDKNVAIRESLTGKKFNVRNAPGHLYLFERDHLDKTRLKW